MRKTRIDPSPIERTIHLIHLLCETVNPVYHYLVTLQP